MQPNFAPSPFRPVSHQPQRLPVSARVRGNPLQALTRRLWADFEPLTGEPERQCCRASLYPGKDFGGVATLQQVGEGVGEQGGGEASQYRQV